MTIHAPLIGRFGNRLYQYTAARKRAELNGWSLMTPAWVGERIFDIPIALRGITPYETFQGYGQQQSDLIYTRRDVLNWLRLKPDIQSKLDTFVPQGEIVAHIRRGDYGGYGIYPLVSRDSYLRAAEHYGFNPADVVFVSEEEPLTHPDFTGELSFLPDFYRMMRAKVLFRANSSFSYWASVLGEALTFCPCIKDKPNAVESDCDFDWGNAQRLANLEFTTDLHLFKEEERYDYPLTPDDLVIDVGGYNGDFAVEINRRYGCCVDVFEPSFPFSERIEKRVRENHRIRVFQQAIGNTDGPLEIHIKGDMTGAYADGPSEQCSMIDAIALPNSSLLKLNCEGYEYNILERLLESECAENHRAIQVQFHKVVPDYARRYIAIRDGLLRTHRLTYDAPFCWQSFELRT